MEHPGRREFSYFQSIYRGGPEDAPRARGAGNNLTSAAGGGREGQEVAPQTLGRSGRRIGVEEQSAELFPSPQNFPAPRAAPAVVRGSQVEELERAVEGVLEPILPSGIVGADR